MEIGVLIAATFGAGLGYLMWFLAGKEVEREQKAEVERQGGFDISKTPWVTAGENEFLSPLHPYSKEEIAEMKRLSSLSAPTSPPPPPRVSAPVSVPSPPSPPDTQEPSTNQRFTPVHEPQFEPIAPVVAPVTGSDWLIANQLDFPVEPPPEKVECYAERQQQETAEKWIREAVAAGISQNKIITEVFGAKKGGNKIAKRIVALVKEVKSES